MASNSARVGASCLLQSIMAPLSIIPARHASDSERRMNLALRHGSASRAYVQANWWAVTTRRLRHVAKESDRYVGLPRPVPRRDRGRHSACVSGLFLRTMEQLVPAGLWPVEWLVRTFLRQSRL